MNRYAAKLLFRYEVGDAPDPDDIIPFMMDTINFIAENDQTAYEFIQNYAKDKENTYENSEGESVKFVFQEIVDAIRFDFYHESELVWFDGFDERADYGIREDAAERFQAMLKDAKSRESIRLLER